MIEIPMEDSTALSYLAEYYGDMDQTEKDELIARLSPLGKQVAQEILSPGHGDSNADVRKAAQTLKEWAQKASEAR